MSSLENNHWVESLLQVNTSYLCLMLEPCIRVVNPQKPIAPTGHHNLLWLRSIKSRHKLCNCISYTSLCTCHLLQHAIVHPPIKQKWVSFLSHNVHMVWIEFRLQYLAKVHFLLLENVLAIGFFRKKLNCGNWLSWWPCIVLSDITEGSACY